MELSKRLQAVADLVTLSEAVADIGTDHGYIPIYLAENGLCQKAVAMDINEGPLEKAKEHIEACGLGHMIETRLSDGLKELKPMEVKSIIIAGMGGGLAVSILEAGAHVLEHAGEVVLQPQSEIHKVRQYLAINGYRIVQEDMVKDDGKFYTMMRAIHGEESPYSLEELRFGRILIENHHPVLKEFLARELGIKKEILGHLKELTGVHIEARVIEINDEVNLIEQVLSDY